MLLLMFEMQVELVKNLRQTPYGNLYAKCGVVLWALHSFYRSKAAALHSAAGVTME